MLYFGLNFCLISSENRYGCFVVNSLHNSNKKENKKESKNSALLLRADKSCADPEEERIWEATPRQL